MGYFETYKSRLQSHGNSSTESQLNATKNIINKTFETSPSFAEVLVNNVLTGVIISLGRTSDKKSLLFKPDVVVNKGSFVEIGNEDYLVIDFNVDNQGVYPAATIQQCNSFFPLPGVDVKTQIGTNSFGEPKYQIVPGTPTLLPCIVETSITSETTDRAINLPEGNVKITISYTEHKNLKVGKSFELYGEDYEIIGIDPTQSINKVGLLIIHGKREVK